jgi:MFS family permease
MQPTDNNSSTALMEPASGRSGIPPICFLTGLINAFDGPARQVIVVDFVGRHRVDKAVSLFEVSLSLSRMAGPALGGVLLDVLGPRSPGSAPVSSPTPWVPARCSSPSRSS